MRAVALLLCCACASVPHLTPTQLAWATAKWPGVEATELEHGRSLYVTRCGSCHAPPMPLELKALGDDELLHEMTERAKLSADDVVQVMRFVDAVTSASGGVAAR